MRMPKVFVPTGAWNYRAGVTAEEVIASARRAEAAGIDGLFAGDHVTFYGTGNDGLINLAAVAAHTERVLLQTSVYLLALRHPTPVALQVALLDQLARGRFILGIGIGGEDPNEWWACGVDPRTRARRTDEAMQILRSLWTQEETTFEGKYFRLRNVRMQPKPFRDDGVPMWVGGRSDAAVRRAARYGDGYTGIWISPRRFREVQELLAQFAAEAGRGDARFQFGMQIWLGVDRDESKAREKVSRRMEGFYKIPFERFERYVPYGPPEKVAEFIMQYVEAGCEHVNLVAADRSQEAVLEAALQVREALQSMCGASA